MEEKLKAKKEELSEFAHSMSHDLRNSITKVKGYIDLFNEDNNYMFLDNIYNESFQVYTCYPPIPYHL